MTPKKKQRVDLQEAVRMANADERVAEFLQNFAGDQIRLSTEDRCVDFRIQKDGTIDFIDSKPADCPEIKTTEDYLDKLWRSLQNQETVDYQEFKDNVDLPAGIKNKIFWKNVMSND
jgi:hypothetical protein